MSLPTPRASALVVALLTLAGCRRACRGGAGADVPEDRPVVDAPAPRPATRAAPRPSPGCRGAARPLAARETLRVDGVERSFAIGKRPRRAPSEPAPLVLAFHGSGGDGASFAAWIEGSRGDALDAWTVYPDAVVRQIWGPEIATHWGQEEDLPFVDAIVRRVAEGACIDEARVLAFGWSSGGYFTNQLACTRSATFAAVASLASGPMRARCTLPSPALLEHDRDDHSVVYSEGRLARDTLQRALGCGEDAARWPAGAPLACRAFLGCAADRPLVWCESRGEGHGIPRAAIGASFDFFALF